MKSERLARGLSMAALALTGLWTVWALGWWLPDGCAPFRLHLLVFWLILVVHICCHELGHALIFCRRGVAIRAYYVGPLIWRREAGSHELHWRWNMLTLIGGVVVPEVTPLQSEDDFRRWQTTFAKAVAAGPRASLLTAILLALSAILLGYSAAPFLRSVALCGLIANCIVILVVLASSLLHTDVLYGDYPAAALLRSDNGFFAANYYEYTALALAYKTLRQKNDWLRQRLIRELAGRSATNPVVVNALEIMITETLAGCLPELPPAMKKQALALTADPRRSASLGTETGLLLRQRLALWLAMEGRLEDARAYFLAIPLTNSKNKTDIYLHCQGQTLLGLADERDWLRQDKHICPTSAAAILRCFEGYLATEQAINELQLDKQSAS